MDAGLLYLVWSLAPARTAVLPSVKLTTVESFTGLPEEVEQQVSLCWLCSRACLVLVPINWAGHWTLLAFAQPEVAASSVGAQAALPPADTDPAAAASLAAKTDCSKCLGAGCSRCSYGKAVKYAQRKQEEQLVFDPAAWPVLPAGCWSVKYYDPLPKESTLSRQQAGRILAYFSELGLPQDLPAREPGLCQGDPVSCGLYCLHWAESLLREYRGGRPLCD